MGKRSKGFNKTELDVVNSRLASLIDVADISVPKIIKKVSANIQRDVIAAAPIVTGNLRKSIYRDVGQYKARIFVDTTKTDPRRNNYEYGRIVEHGRAGRYRTTPYWYKIVKQNLGTLVQFINSAVRDSAIQNSKK